MSRTNIDLDDELVADVMRRFGVKTKKAAVDMALRRLVGAPLSRDSKRIALLPSSFSIRCLRGVCGTLGGDVWETGA